MLRPIDGDGTSRYSIGALGLENAAAVAEPPATPTSPGNAAANAVATANGKSQEPRTFPPKTISAPIRSFRARQLAGVLLCGQYSGIGPDKAVFDADGVR